MSTYSNMEILLGLIIFIAGLSIGSFLNVVIWRLHTKEGFVRSRSYCPKCKTTLRPVDMVPLLSFILLRGRCRECKQSISWQYPAVEFAAAAAFVGLFWRYGLGDMFALYSVFSAFLIVVFVFDLKHYLILDRVMIPAAIVALLGGWWIGTGLLDLAIGALVGGGFFLLQFLLSRGRWIGGGDIRLGAVMGLMLGWQVTLVALFLSYLGGSVIGVSLVAASRKKWQSRLPFGVFLTVATYVCLLWGEEIMRWYLAILGGAV